MRHTLPASDALPRLIADARSFYERGWMLGTSGNLSIATAAAPLRFHVTASGRHKGALTPRDFVEVDADARPVQPDAPRPSDETHIHAELYRRTDAGAVYHVHQLSAALCSTHFEGLGAVPVSDLEMIKGLGFPTGHRTLHIPIVPNLPDIPALARRIGEVLDPAVPGVLILRHGIYTWGRTPSDAFRHIEIFEYLFQYTHQAVAAGLL